MTLYRIDIDTDTTVSQFDRIEAAKQGITDVINFLSGVEGGAIDSDVIFKDTPVKATATLTFSASGQVADETFTVNGVTFTAKDSGASGDQFNISGSVTTTAANVVTAVNASSSAGVDGCITASSDAGVVTFTADVAGVHGNGFTLSEALTNCTAVDFASGSDGTSYTLAEKD